MDDIKPISMSDEYRSGFHLKVRKMNGKVVSTSLEISDHNQSLQTTLGSLGRVLEDLKLTGEVGMSPSGGTGGAGKVPEHPSNDYRYYCVTCGYNFPAFKEMPSMQKYHCVRCDRWMMFEKKLRPKN